MGSRRLPGKVLLPLNGHTVISEVIERCQKISGVDQTVCAISEAPGNDALASTITAAGISFIRGSETDVLSRYVRAAQETEASVIVRITADCPLISPELCSQVVTLRQFLNLPYASNVGEPRTFPKGLDCEVFTLECLLDANRFALGEEREHVTPWMRRINMEARKFSTVNSPWPIEGRLTLDTDDDYRTICAHFGHEPHQHLRAA
jgi:spore coat polysaccharide biosynthesis protein SpsF (cytidylyltransferase family)